MNWPGKDALTVAIIAWRLCLSCAAAQVNEDFNQGIREFHAGNYSSATRLFAHAEEVSPNATDALLYEAKSLIHLEDFAEAEKALRGYISAHHESSDAAYLLGFVLHRQNHPAESLAAYTQAAALLPPPATISRSSAWTTYFWTTMLRSLIGVI